METFGYEEHDEEFDNILKLNQVTLSCKKDEIIKIADFLNKIKYEIENEKVEDGNHWHYRDYNKSWTEEAPDLIIYVDNNSNS